MPREPMDSPAGTCAPARMLVTGAGGFLGRALVREITARGGGSPKALFGPADGVPARASGQILSGDIEDRRVLQRAVRGADLVVHMAGPPSVADSFRRPEEHARVHLGGTRALAAACRESTVRRIVYVSSAEVYGMPERREVDEEHALAPRSPYGEAKVAAEQLLGEWSTDHGREVVILRLFSVFGPRAGHDASVVGDLLRQARTASAIQPFCLEPVRDYCYVEDVVDALWRAATAPVRGSHRVFNVGSGRGVTVGELAETIRAVVGRDVPIAPRRGSDRPRDRDILRLVCNPTRARTELGWRARLGLGEGLRRMLSARGAAAGDCA